MTPNPTPAPSSTQTRLTKIIRVLLIATVTTFAVAGSGCGNSETAQDQFATPTYPFSFEYPSKWKLTRNAAFAYGGSGGERSVSITLKAPFDLITITQYKLKKTLPAGVNGNRTEIDKIVKRLTRQANGSASDGRIVNLAGSPGYQYVTEYPAKDNQTLRNRLTFLFKGDDEFMVNCQSSAANREALEIGCDKILQSLKFDSPN